MDLKWTDGHTITVDILDNQTVIHANREGLLSLAGHLQALSEGKSGDHIHYDSDNSL